MMLDYLGELQASVKIQKAIADVIREGKTVTRDLNPGNPVGTVAMTDAIVRRIQEL